MTLYTYFLLYIPQARVDTYCESQFLAPKTEVVIKLCEEDVWKKSFPNAYNLK